MSLLSSLLPILWTILHSFLYGFHISSLNGVQDAVLCPDAKDVPTRWGLKECVDFTDTQYGVIVTIFTLGGLLGSVGAGIVTRRFGRIGTLRVAEICFIIGAIGVGSANALVPMILARIVIGIASGLVMVTVPLCLVEIAPRSYTKLYGTLHQISIGLGVITAQSLSLPFGKAFQWRYVFMVAASIGGALLLGGIGMGGKREEGGKDEEDEEMPLVPSDEGEAPMTITDVWRSEDRQLGRGLLVAAIAHMAQQISGISPVMYFSTRIFTPVFHANSKLVALGIMAIGIPFNFVPGLLPSSWGSKRMLLLSSAGTAISSFFLIIGLNHHHQALSGISVVAFVLSFSIGLAPMPWVVLSEVMPPEARTAGGSVGVSVNWLTNFAAGSSFLPLQQALKNGDSGEGNVFYLFTATSVLAVVGIWLSFRLFERGRRE